MAMRVARRKIRSAAQRNPSTATMPSLALAPLAANQITAAVVISVTTSAPIPTER
jgi:hypothetical protein